MQVVLSSSAGSGRVLPRTVLRERGYVVADNLLPQKARVLAMLALTRTDDPVEYQCMLTRTDAAGPSSRPMEPSPETCHLQRMFDAY